MSHGCTFSKCGFHYNLFNHSPIVSTVNIFVYKSFSLFYFFFWFIREVTWSLIPLMPVAFWILVGQAKKVCHISLIINEQFYSNIIWHPDSRVTYERIMMCSESICLGSYRENLVPGRLVDSSSPSESLSFQHLGFSEIL